MFKINDTVLYGSTGVCRIEEMVDKEIGGVTKSYYVLKPLAQNNSTVFVPTDSEVLVGKMRQMLSSDEIRDLIRSIPQEGDLWLENDADRRAAFSRIIGSGDRLELMALIRTLYLRQQEQRQKGKKLHISDERFLKEAERLLNDEFSTVLDIRPDQVAAFIAEQLQEQSAG